MQAVEFETQLNEEQTITVPSAHTARLAGKKLRVMILFEESSSPPRSEEHYTKGYDQKDSLYDTY